MSTTLVLRMARHWPREPVTPKLVIQLAARRQVTHVPRNRAERLCLPRR
eukprot:CAMPEP_0117483664 /NCGR_PEP_ID=MMETSP0784-20121206/14057_1 /TAXON_ID=39447 /ORGANISM="" /LENGTH=48 /DNA_ID= /DNA_START= /DNA_END= /DNA_ORIENTATION=